MGILEAIVDSQYVLNIGGNVLYRVSSEPQAYVRGLAEELKHT